uniref:Serine/threonine-protein kinase 1 n=1 Tax=Caenorhabditis japonica TaxID=281687 RepID=A0A8R1HQH8_CAEJA
MRAGRRQRLWLFESIRMIKRKLQDLAVCCSYHVDFLHEKKHSVKEFKRKYEVLDEIGRGGFGIVYEATSRQDDKLPVAVKFVQHKHVRSWTMTCRQLIPSEVCHLETCSDIPGVIRILDWFANSKGFLIVMERPENCMDLFDMVSVHGPLSEDMAKFIFKQVVDTVFEMYSKHGLLHRDIKDENLIVSMNTGEVKLVDFGATAYAEKATKKEFQGTRSYCPPEWFRDQLYLPLEATSWSLGVLLFILLTGKLPFRNEIQICLGNVKFPSGLSKEVCQLVKSCLTTSTTARASLSQISAHPWMECDRSFFTGVDGDTFEEALMDIKNPPTPTEDKEAEEEDNELNDVVLTRSRDSRADLDDDSICTMVTAAEDRYEVAVINKLQNAEVLETGEKTNLMRSESRYDNISSSSFCDYVSLASSFGDPSQFTSSSDIYQSAYEIFPAAGSSNSLGTRVGPVKSASAYNLVRMRKKSSIFKSFDTELDPVDEMDHQPPMPETSSAMCQSTYSNGEDVTICEEVVAAALQELPRARDSALRMSRHRPLRFGIDSETTPPPTLAIFQVSPTTSVG